MRSSATIGAPWALALVINAACSGGAPVADARAVHDAQAADSAAIDAAGGAIPLAGFGAISGDCGLIDDTVLAGAESRLVHNAIDFADRPFTEGDVAELSVGGREIYLDGNAGGSSIYSEIFAYEVLYRCDLAALLKTETEIVYDTQGVITDFLVEIDGRKVGVSVTRAFGWPPENPYTVEQARALLEDKLADVLASSANVSAEDAWVKQILHILAYEPIHADSVTTAYGEIDPGLRADTIVVVTVTDGMDGFMY